MTPSSDSSVTRCEMCGCAQYIAEDLPREQKYETHQIATIGGRRVLMCYGGCQRTPKGYTPSDGHEFVPAPAPSTDLASDYVQVCTCTGGPDFEGPARDCPIHGERPESVTTALPDPRCFHCGDRADGECEQCGKFFDARSPQ